VSAVPWSKSSPGEADLRLAQLLPPSVGPEAPLLVHKAQKEERPVRGRVHRIQTSAGRRTLVMEARPLARATTPGGYSGRQTFLVTFELKRTRESRDSRESGREAAPAESGDANARRRIGSNVSSAGNLNFICLRLPS
jgi:hypothetical protein